MGRRFKPNRSIKRDSGKKDTKQKVIIVCEGESTEPHYFRNFKIEYRSDLIELDIYPGSGSPKTLVEKAVAKKEEELKDARKKNNSFEKNFAVWVVFDQDEHDYIPESKNRASANGIKVIYSNPCFELWPVLHYDEYSSKPEHRHDMQRKLSELMPGYNYKKSKSLDYDQLKGKYDTARRHSVRLKKEQEDMGSKDGNPSTNVEELCDQIIKNGRK